MGKIYNKSNIPIDVIISELEVAKSYTEIRGSRSFR